jgi:hypothetical protein
VLRGIAEIGFCGTIEITQAASVAAASCAMQVRRPGGSGVREVLFDLDEGVRDFGGLNGDAQLFA